MPDFAILLSVLVLKLGLTSSEVRWCAEGDISEDFASGLGATSYNDELYACMECSEEAKLVLVNELERYECCNGSVASDGLCADEGAFRSCSVGKELVCDGKKQCYDGRDEMGCNGCQKELFSCEHATTGPQCLPVTKLCDSVKDCKGGEDEALCPYFGGRCDGYLCGNRHPKCINYSEICDGVKDCLDGSDESNCLYCPNQFRCRVYFKQDISATTGECVGRFRVCDGEPDCANDVDEARCHRWQSWLTWSDCGTETQPCTRIRRRSCVDINGVVVSATECYGNEDDLDESHIGVCPECLPDTTTPPPATSEHATTRNNATSHPPTTVSDFTSDSRTVNRAGVPFNTGALIGTVVAGSLVLIVLLFVIGVCICHKKGRTGFWRPPSKLPRPSSSRLPGVAVSGRDKLRPGEISHPYPIVDKPKIAYSEANSPSNATTRSLRSVSPNGADSGIEDGGDGPQNNGGKTANNVGGMKVDGLKKAAASHDGGKPPYGLVEIGRTMV